MPWRTGIFREKIRFEKQLVIEKPATIVGVVRANVQLRLADKPFPEADGPYTQFPDVLMLLDLRIVTRSAVPTSTFASEIKDAVREVDPGQSVFHISTR